MTSRAMRSTRPFASPNAKRPPMELRPAMRYLPVPYTMTTSVPPSRSALAVSPVPAPVPTMGVPLSYSARRRDKTSFLLSYAIMLPPCP